jgi:hypothetical protein
MKLWIGIRNNVLIFHLIRWHLTFFGGFRDNIGIWHPEPGIGRIYCKCGDEV